MLRAGTAGWTLPKQSRAEFPEEGSHLERYAARFSCVEINSSFHREHRPATYERWAAAVDPGFRFSLKLPKEITHKRKLMDCSDVLEPFLAQTAGLGDRLGVYIVQLAPSHHFERDAAQTFFERFRRSFLGNIACEPRHDSWNSVEAGALLSRYAITRIGADPVLFDNAGTSKAYGGFAYYRWHGSPRTYYSSYGAEALDGFARIVAEHRALETWCIFDNTALGEATANALRFIQAVRQA